MIYCGDTARQRKKGFGLKAISCGEVTGKLMENNGYVVGLFVQTHLSVSSLSPVIKCSLLSTGKEPFLWEICVLLLGRKGEIREPFLHLLFLQCLQLKIINMPKWHILGLHVLNLISLELTQICVLETKV